MELSTLSLASLIFLLSSRRRGLPPGPPALLFLAKCLALRRSISDLPRILSELHARHGPVISVHVRPFRPLVFVSDRHLAHHALVQSGATFADRPKAFEPGILFTSGARNINVAPNGPYWRLVRRNLSSEVARSSLFAAARRRTRSALISDLLLAAGSSGSPRPVTVRPLFRRALFDLLAYMCFGAWLAPEVLDEIQGLQLCVVHTFLSYPIFYLFPSVTKTLFRKRWAAHVSVRRRLDEIILPLIHARRFSAGDLPCYADSLLGLRVPDQEGDRPLTDGELVSLCLEFLSAGNDGMATLLEWIMAVLVNRPDILCRLHKEMTRKPELINEADGDLPQYLRAVVLEVLRLHPPIHFLVPHGVRGGGAEIGGYKVPRGAEVNVLVVEVGRDETVWTAAREYRPERFLDSGEGCDMDITGRKEIKMIPFSAGPRMCPAYNLGMLHVAYFVGAS